VSRLSGVEIALQERDPRFDARTCLEVLLNAPRISRMARIRGWFLEGNGSHVIRLIREIGGDASWLPGVEIALQERDPRFDARAYLELLLAAPPRRARGKLSKRMTRMRVRFALAGQSSIPSAKY
jgi:hypothetical protein